MFGEKMSLSLLEKKKPRFLNFWPFISFKNTLWPNRANIQAEEFLIESSGLYTTFLYECKGWLTLKNFSFYTDEERKLIFFF